MIEARRLRVSGTVQGVGFRPFVARQAEAHHLSGWVLNADHGVEIHVEGAEAAVEAFETALRRQAPPAADITSIESTRLPPSGVGAFAIRESERRETPTVRISADLPVCDECLQELFDDRSRRFWYPYITCTNCGPRYSIIRSLPYDREQTTMAEWALCSACADEYGNVRDRRFHAESIACPVCGPDYRLRNGRAEDTGSASPIADTADLLRRGAIVAIKGVGGYHLACDAANSDTVRELRARKYRKSKPFAVMVKDLAAAGALVELGERARALLTSPARPIVLLPRRASLPGVAPDHRELGVMLPYTPVHHVLFAAGAPEALVMTSANRSSEPIAFDDGDALDRLGGIADAFLVGQRPIARRVDDSVVRSGPDGTTMLRRGRGHAPAIVARLPTARPILALGADLKNAITLVVHGNALVSHHIGDLEHASARNAFRETVRDLTRMYEVNWAEMLVVHDKHPHYASTAHALELPSLSRRAVQHHRAHVASVLAEREAFDTRVVGVAFDGTGYGDDGTIWGGEFLVGSLVEGFSREASLRPFALPGGDAAARFPVQAAAGVLSDVDGLPDLAASPFSFTERYARACRLVQRGVRTFTCTSAGRLFDAAAALLGFTGEIEHEGQAAAWLENLAWLAGDGSPLPFDLSEREVDVRPALRAVAQRRFAGVDVAVLARAFHETVAVATAAMALRLCSAHDTDTVVLSGGTFQNALLVERIRSMLSKALRVWTNREVPPNDGGISLGQAALAAVQPDPYQ